MQRLSLTLETGGPESGVRTTNTVLLVVPCFRNALLFSTEAYINTNYGKHGTKETVIIADRQAPVKQKQKKTDHIDEELRLKIFLKTSAIFFFSLLF